MIKIIVYKSKKILKLVENGKILSTYVIGIGRVEKGAKISRSDMRTPEGEYKICVKNPKSKFNLSLGLNYPNLQDANLGLANKTISQQEYDSILSAYETHGGSDWKTALGGEIYIHGGLEDKTWSEGCIRMYNRDIKQIFDSIELGAQVIIYK